jgi:uncharacterized protein YegL
MPLLFIMTDGSPSDLKDFDAAVPELQKRGFAKIVACAAGPKARIEHLLKLTDTVVHLDITDSTAFQQFFVWVSTSVTAGSMSMGSNTQLTLPPPPNELRIVV